MKRFKAHLSLKEGAKPKFCRPRSVPFAIKETVAREIDRLEENGTLRRVEHSEWGTPIVPVPEKGWEYQDLWGFQGHIESSLTSGAIPPANAK